MYETALPDDTLAQLEEMEESRLVVGIPSYRNARTIQAITTAVAQGLHHYYAKLHPVIVNVDGLAYDETLALAQSVALPSTVRQVTTRYLGVQGKGSAVRAVFESATRLGAAAVVIVEADNTTFEPSWMQAWVEPILQKAVDYLLPRYDTITPHPIMNEVIGVPLLKTLFASPLRYPGAGDIAVSGSVARFVAERDVWETDVARDGVDFWMTLELLLGEGRIGEVQLPPKHHKSYDSLTGLEAKFLQETGTLFRVGSLHERLWYNGHKIVPPTVVQFGSKPPAIVSDSPPDGYYYWQEGLRAVRYGVEGLWQQVLLPQTLQHLSFIIRDNNIEQFDAKLWAHLVYDFMVVYNLGEGDPDKVINALYPLHLMRYGAMWHEAAKSDIPFAMWESLIETQCHAFADALPYLRRRWDTYVPPEDE